ncbi:MAG: metal-dependent hydrolase [Acidobacteria bacterium]|nr:MAG: metal-dependent hydrolase [Acidobacteriota bacterium]
MANRLEITWLGHATFVLKLPNGKRVLLDPWLGNPNCPPAFSKPDALKPVDLILVTHGHSDHITDVVGASRATGAPVMCQYELAQYFRRKGLTDVREMNIGGTQEAAGLRITMTWASHTSSAFEGNDTIYLGSGAGFVLRAPDTPTVYISGDTGLFGDMKLIGELYKPQIAFLPIGDLYTMGPDAAAIAAEWLGVRQVVPSHWGTFPALTGTAEALASLVAPHNIEVLRLQPGETAR